METPVTNAILEKKLTAYKRRKPKPTSPKPIPIKKRVEGIRTMKSSIETRTGMYAKSDLQTFLEELQAFTSFIEQQIETAPEAVTEKKPGGKPRPQV
jgi:transcription initiation factor TFIIIB Brf1 subunit/transcription initiation factor TFIIB